MPTTYKYWGRSGRWAKNENNLGLEAHHILRVLYLPEDCSDPDTCLFKIFHGSLLLSDIFFVMKNTKFIWVLDTMLGAKDIISKNYITDCNAVGVIWVTHTRASFHQTAFVAIKFIILLCIVASILVLLYDFWCSCPWTIAYWNPCYFIINNFLLFFSCITVTALHWFLEKNKTCVYLGYSICGPHLRIVERTLQKENC